MARLRHNDRIVYVIAWETASIVKIGWTDHLSRRRRAFTGGEVILALEFPDFSSGFDFECEANRAAFQTWPRAFASREESLSYVKHGGGYFECYRATATEALDLVASQYLTMLRHDAPSRCSVTVPVTIIRTDGRTNGDKWFRDGKSFTAVTHARAGRISSFVTQERVP